MLYRIFDFWLESELELPELVADAPSGNAAAGPPVVRVFGGLPQGFVRERFEQVVDWATPGGQLFSTVARCGDDFLFGFSGYAEFLISSVGNIYCHREAGCSAALLRHFLINQAIPRYLAEQGHLMLHASAVVLPAGQAVAFLGESGFGKSTLAAAFERQGARLLADDCLLLRPREGRVEVHGAFPGIRLAPAAWQQLGGSDVLGGPDLSDEAVLTYTLKQQRLLGVPAVGAAALQALFLLNDPANAPAQGISICTTQGAEAMMALLRSVFSLDPSAPASTVRGFKTVGQVVAQGLPVVTLAYPREHRLLPEILEAISGFAGP